ncbi:MAG: hypothetical protein JOZ87_35505 [Chloroflexi bacterium]|nr:hypothetical protein [Chloroflexota bacterium]
MSDKYEFSEHQRIAAHELVVKMLRENEGWTIGEVVDKVMPDVPKSLIQAYGETFLVDHTDLIRRGIMQDAIELMVPGDFWDSDENPLGLSLHNDADVENLTADEIPEYISGKLARYSLELVEEGHHIRKRGKRRRKQSQEMEDHFNQSPSE